MLVICLNHYRKRKCFMGDFKDPSEINSPNSRLKYWIASQSTVSNQKKRIKYLYKQHLDLKKRIKTLDNLVDHLKNDKKVISDNCFTVLKVCILFYYSGLCSACV